MEITGEENDEYIVVDFLISMSFIFYSSYILIESLHREISDTRCIRLV